MTGRKTFALAALLLAPATLAAQQPLRVDLSARVGLYAPQRNLGPAARAEPRYVHAGRIDPGPSLELQVLFGRPSAPLALRLTGLATRPAGFGASFNCFPGVPCEDILLRPASADARVLAGIVDLVYSPFNAAGALRPYLVLGAGIKQYRFAWSAAQTMVNADEHGETTQAVHGALRFEFEVLGATLQAELGNYWSPDGRKFDSCGMSMCLLVPRTPVQRREQHDLSLSLGWRIARF